MGPWCINVGLNYTCSLSLCVQIIEMWGMPRFISRENLHCRHLFNNKTIIPPVWINMSMISDIFSQSSYTMPKASAIWMEMDIICAVKILMTNAPPQMPAVDGNHWYLTKWTEHENGHLAPVPLSIFRSNSQLDENSKRFSFEYTRPITTIFCTRHDSDTVVTCAKYRCDRSSIFETKAFWIFI